MQFLHATNFYNLALTQVLSGHGAEGTPRWKAADICCRSAAVDVTVDQASLNFGRGQP